MTMERIGFQKEPQNSGTRIGSGWGGQVKTINAVNLELSFERQRTLMAIKSQITKILLVKLT